MTINWRSGTSWYGGSQDLSFARGAANVLNLTNGSTGGGTIATAGNSPAQITANQNDYNPGSASLFQRWNTDASRNVTGLTFTGTKQDGQRHIIVNVGSNDIVLVHQSASSTAANRFLNTTGADITLTADQQAECIYDNTTARWRCAKRN